MPGDDHTQRKRGYCVLESSAGEQGGTPAAHAPETKTRSIRRLLTRYVVTVGAVVLALLMREAIGLQFGGELPPYITFYPVVLLAAIVGDCWSGVVATALSAVAAAYWAFPPKGSFAVSRASDVIGMAMFCTLGLCVSFVVERYHRNSEKLAAYKMEEAVRKERSKADEERRAAEATGSERLRLHDVLDTLPVMVCLLTSDHHVAFANRRFREKFGDADGRHCYEYCGVGEPCGVCEAHGVLENGQPHHWERPGPDGKTIIDVHNFPFTDPDGSPLILEMDVDITEQRRAEAELQRHRDHLEELVKERTSQLEAANTQLRSEIDVRMRIEAELKHARAQAEHRAAELGAILDNMTERVVVCNREGYVVLMNEAARSTYVTDAAPVPQRVSDMYERIEFLELDGRPVPFSELPIMRVLGGERVRSAEYKVRFNPSGRQFIFSYTGAPIRDLNGDVVMGIYTSEDITERKRAEAALKEREQHLRTILQTTQEAFYLLDMQGMILDVNDAYSVMSGYSTEELLRMRVSDLEFLESEQAVADHMQRINRQGRDRFETQHRRKDGSVFDIETSVTFQEIGGGQLVCFLRDITDRKRAEESLRASEERFRRVVEGAPLGMFIATDGLFRYLNPAALRLLGALSAEQLVNQSVYDRVHPDSREVVRERARQVRAERKVAPFMEMQYLRLDGTAFDVEVTSIPFVFEGRNGAIAFLHDISLRKQEENQRSALEQQLRQAQKMEAVGRLAGGIAHDFNNVLMVIQSYTEMLQEVLPYGPLRRNTQEIMKAADRAARLTRQMLAFSRKQILSPAMLDLNAVIDETAKMLKRVIGEDIEFQVNPAKSIWTIQADSDQIVQVLMNLVVNARDATAQGGTLTISTENVTVAQVSTSHPYVSPGDYVSLSVADTGCGVSPELQAQVFEPFFTTKEVGKGTGLGLSTVYGIVKQSGGYVWVDSEFGQGACFTIYLPRIQGTCASQITTSAEPQPRGTETILVAEDEEPLREAICEYLRSLEYTVLAASSGNEALSVVSEHQGTIDLLITDLVMPKMSGRELSQMLGVIRPEMKTIYMSGYTDDAVLRHGVEEMGAAFLPKPFSLGTLARKVHDTLVLQSSIRIRNT